MPFLRPTLRALFVLSLLLWASLACDDQPGAEAELSLQERPAAQTQASQDEAADDLPDTSGFSEVGARREALIERYTEQAQEDIDPENVREAADELEREIQADLSNGDEGADEDKTP